nr:replicase [Jasmine virus H]
MGLLSCGISVGFKVLRTTLAVQTGLALGVTGGIIEHVTGKKISYDPATNIVCRIAGISPTFHSLCTLPDVDPEPMLRSADYLYDHPTMEYDHCVEVDVESSGETKVVKRNGVHKKPSFAAILCADAKNHFGGTPSPSKANALSVMKYLVNKCNEHKLTVLQTRECSALALPLVFSPDAMDKYTYRHLNSSEAFERRVDFSKSTRVDPVWLGFFTAPLQSKTWKRAFLQLTRLGSQEAFQFIK